MANSGFKINKSGIRKMTQEIQREFDRNPVTVPINTGTPSGRVLAGRDMHPVDYSQEPNVTYNGPVVLVTGDNTQLAWNNTGTVNQGHSRTEQIAPGYEQLAAALTELLAKLPELPLDGEDASEVRTATEGILAEVVTEEPRQGIIKQGLTMLRGLLTPILLGATEAVTEETQKSSASSSRVWAIPSPFESAVAACS